MYQYVTLTRMYGANVADNLFILPCIIILTHCTKCVIYTIDIRVEGLEANPINSCTPRFLVPGIFISRNVR